jgi:hypothetical protein
LNRQITAVSRFESILLLPYSGESLVMADGLVSDVDCCLKTRRENREGEKEPNKDVLVCTGGSSGHGSLLPMLGNVFATHVRSE